MKFFVFFASSIFLLSFFASCGNVEKESGNDSLIITDSGMQSKLSIPSIDTTLKIEVATFIAKDSTNKPLGWGYDLVINGKRTIHQPIIPAVQGNDAFASESDAKKIGDLAVMKMKTTGEFPTISVHDLDSLGIKHQ